MVAWVGMIIRDATLDDVPAMTDTLNWAIRESDAIFRKHEATLAEREEYVTTLQNDGYPVLVAESDEGEYYGWALLHPYRSLDVWNGCFEDTIYISPDAHGKGVGTELLGALLERARADERIHTVLALITGDNAPSVALHEKLGFVNQGTIKEVSFKFGKWLDLHHLQIIV